MIFGIKTRKDLKNEIKKLNEQLEEYRGSELVRKVNIVPTTLPLARLKVSCKIPAFLCDKHPELADENIQRSLEDGIKKDLVKYMEIDIFDDPLDMAKQITGTLTVVVPEKE